MPAPKAQRNLADPDFRILKNGATRSYVQAYSAQAAVDGAEQGNATVAVTQEVNNNQQLVPMLTAARFLSWLRRVVQVPRRLCGCRHSRPVRR